MCMHYSRTFHWGHLISVKWLKVNWKHPQKIENQMTYLGYLCWLLQEDLFQAVTFVTLCLPVPLCPQLSAHSTTCYPTVSLHPVLNYPLTFLTQHPGTFVSLPVRPECWFGLWSKVNPTCFAPGPETACQPIRTHAFQHWPVSLFMYNKSLTSIGRLVFLVLFSADWTPNCDNTALHYISV